MPVRVVPARGLADLRTLAGLADRQTPAYKAFLREIGYLAREPAPFEVSPTGVDDELARLAGPQLVVPVLNARFVKRS